MEKRSISGKQTVKILPKQWSKPSTAPIIKSALFRAKFLYKSTTVCKMIHTVKIRIQIPRQTLGHSTNTIYSMVLQLTYYSSYIGITFKLYGINKFDMRGCGGKHIFHARKQILQFSISWCSSVYVHRCLCAFAALICFKPVYLELVTYFQMYH